MNDVFDSIFIECFGNLEDKRYKNKRHRLIDIIAICICATLSGMTDFEQIYEFGVAHKSWFKQYLLLPHGIPSHDTLTKVMSSLNPKAFTEAFLQWVNKLKDLFPENVIPIDGKTLRGSHNKSKGLKNLHIVNAYSYANGLTLGQLAVNEKSNEITAIPILLETLAIKGAIITIDAMGTQTEIAEKIINKSADYVLSAKENQKELTEAIRDVYELSQDDKFNQNLKPAVFRQEITGDHGRIEERTAFALPAETIETQTDLTKWKGMKSIILIKSTNWINQTTETRHYISSIPPTEVQKIAEAIRAHWSVENNLHWVLDVVFQEDNSRIRNRNLAQNMSWIRKMALYLLKQDKSKGSFKSKMIRNCINPSNIVKLLALA